MENKEKENSTLHSLEAGQGRSRAGAKHRPSMTTPGSCPAAPSAGHPPVCPASAAGTSAFPSCLPPARLSPSQLIPQCLFITCVSLSLLRNGEAAAGALRRLHHRAVIPPRGLGRRTSRHLLAQGIQHLTGVHEFACLEK
jgi:hypothetical protein